MAMCLIIQYNCVGLYEKKQYYVIMLNMVMVMVMALSRVTILTTVNSVNTVNTWLTQSYVLYVIV